MEFFTAVAAIYVGMGTFSLVVACALIIGLFISMAFEKVDAIGSLTVVSILLALFYDPTRDLIWTGFGNWDTVALYAMFYFAIGAGWSVFKFWRYAAYMKRRFNQYLESRNETPKSIQAMDHQDKARFVRELERHMNDATKYGEQYPTKPNRIKSVITTWITYWPISAVAYVFEEPIKRTVEFVYDRFTGIYTRISKIYSADFENLRNS